MALPIPNYSHIDWLCLIVTVLCGSFVLGTARVGERSTNLLLSDVNPLLLEMFLGMQDDMKQLAAENQEMKHAMGQMQQQIEMIMTTKKEDPQEFHEKNAPSSDSATTKSHHRALQTSYVTTDEFNLHKNSSQAAFTNLWNFTNRTALTSQRTALVLDSLRLQIVRQNNFTAIKIASLVSRLTYLERRVNNITNTTSTLSTQLIGVEIEMDNNTAFFDDQWDTTVEVMGNLSSRLNSIDNEVDTTWGNVQSQFNATDKAVAALSTQIVNVNTALNTTRGELQNQLNGTNVAVTTLSTDLNDLSSDLHSDLTTTSGNLQSQLNAINTTLDTTRGNLQNQLNATNVAVTTLSTNLNDLSSDLHSDLAIASGNLQGQLNGINQTVQTIKGRCFYSCKDAYNRGFKTSGVYQLCPDVEFPAYCDQSTDGGGWMLFFSYYHIGGQNNLLQLTNVPPTSPTNGYSHMNLNTSGYNSTNIQEIRFYCETSAHPRKIHFKTSNAVVKNIAISANQIGNTAATWSTGYTSLSGHTGNLPAATTHVVAVADGGLWSFPFYKDSFNHWAVRGGDNRWECDDWPNNAAYTTLHNIWVRNVV